MTKKEQLVEEEIFDIMAKKYCKNIMQCKDCKKWEDCKKYEAGIFGKVAIDMILKLRKEKETLTNDILKVIHNEFETGYFKHIEVDTKEFDIFCKEHFDWKNEN